MQQSVNKLINQSTEIESESKPPVQFDRWRKNIQLQICPLYKINMNRVLLFLKCQHWSIYVLRSDWIKIQPVSLTSSLNNTKVVVHTWMTSLTPPSRGANTHTEHRHFVFSLNQ